MERDEKTHDELMAAFREYYKANQHWIARGTRRAGMDTRYWLSEIRRICSDRRDKIMEWRHELNEATEEKKAQKRGGKKDDNAT